MLKCCGFFLWWWICCSISYMSLSSHAYTYTHALVHLRTHLHSCTRTQTRKHTHAPKITRTHKKSHTHAPTHKFIHERTHTHADSYTHTSNIQVAVVTSVILGSVSCVWHDLFICVTWLIPMWHGSWTIHDVYITSLILESVSCHSFVWPVTWPTQSFVWPDSFIRVTWLLLMWRESRTTYETLILSCDLWHDSLILSRGMTHSYVWHDSFPCDMSHELYMMGTSH